MRTFGLTALCTFVLCVAAWALPCDPALAPSCGNRAEGAPCRAGQGIVGTWVLVASFPASMNLCTGYTKDCGDGPCNALETWHYTWEVWECVKGGEATRREGCIREILSRNGTGMCCTGQLTTQPVKPVVPGGGYRIRSKSGGGGCGCAKLELPQEACRQCHDSWRSGNGLMMNMDVGQACADCHDHHKSDPEHKH
jgi:predicted CXXCH cytochrome family protein